MENMPNALPPQVASVPQATVPSPRRGKKVFKVIFIIIGLLILLVVAFIYLPRFLNLFAHDLERVDTSGLAISAPNIPDSENAYFDLASLEGQMYMPSDDRTILSSMVDATSGTSWNDALAHDVIAKNSKTLELFASSSEKSSMYVPSFGDAPKVLSSTPLPNLNDWRNAGLIASIEALALSKEGKNAEAMDRAIRVVKVGQLIADSNQPLIGYLVGIAIKKTGYKAISQIISTSHFSQSEASAYSSALESLHDDGVGLKNSFIIEYYSRTNSLEAALPDILAQDEVPDFAKKDSNNSYYFKPNETKQLDADYTREQIKNVDLSCDAVSNIKAKKQIGSMSFINLYLTENAVGKIIIDVVGSSLKSVLAKRCETNGELDALVQKLSSR